MKRVYLNELEEVSGELISCSQNDITNKIEELKQATNNFVWQGMAYDSYMRGFNIKINDLSRMNEGLTKIAKFLLQVGENYNNTNEKINNAYEELIEEFKQIREW